MPGKKKAKKTSKKKSAKKAKKKAKKGGKKKKSKAKKKAKGKGKKKLTKRQKAARKAARTRAEKKAKRSRAAKKAAKTRKKGKAKKKAKKGAKKGKGKKKGKKKSSKKSPSQRERAAYNKRRRYEQKLAKQVAKRQKRDEKKARTKGRKVAKKDKEIARYERKIARLESERARLQAAAEKRRHHRHHRRHHHARAANPIGSSGAMEFLAGFFGAVTGGGLALFADRFASTHALTTGSSGSGYADTPAAGQVYNSQGPNTPIWSSWSRVALALAAILTPLGISAAIPDKHPHAKSFFQIAFFGALTVDGTKLLADAASSLAGSTALGARLLAPEGAAVAQLGSQGQNSGSALASVDLSQATNAAGTQVNQQAGQTQAFVAGGQPRRLVGNGATAAMTTGNTATKTPMNAGSTGAFVPSAAAPTPVTKTTPVPVVTSTTPTPTPTQVNPTNGGSDGGLPGNTTGPVCLACAKAQHAGPCDDFSFDPSGEVASDGSSGVSSDTMEAGENT